MEPHSLLEETNIGRKQCVVRFRRDCYYILGEFIIGCQANFSVSAAMLDTLRDLIDSTINLHKRFGVTPQLEVTLRVFQEEVDELIEAAQQATDKQHIAEEAADVFVTAIGMCLAAGVDGEEIIKRTRAVIEKNDAKTHLTHTINENGKIARRHPQ
jgi:NTP pyrophosphatase (non-canonical NTP hydrolase)